LTYRINKYIADLVDFDGAALGDDEINASEISGRALHLAVPKGRVSPIQREAIEAIRARERMMNDGVDILIGEF